MKGHLTSKCEENSEVDHNGSGSEFGWGREKTSKPIAMPTFFVEIVYEEDNLPALNYSSFSSFLSHFPRKNPQNSVSHLGNIQLP